MVGLRLPASGDGLLKVATVGAVGKLDRRLDNNAARIAAVRIVPSLPRAGRRGLQGLLLGLVHVGKVRFIKRLADFAAQNRSQQRSASNGKHLTAPVTNRRASNGPNTCAQDGADLLFHATVTAAQQQGPNEQAHAKSALCIHVSFEHNASSVNMYLNPRRVSRGNHLQEGGKMTLAASCPSPEKQDRTRNTRPIGFHGPGYPGSNNPTLEVCQSYFHAGTPELPHTCIPQVLQGALTNTNRQHRQLENLAGNVKCPGNSESDHVESIACWKPVTPGGAEERRPIDPRAAAHYSAVTPDGLSSTAVTQDLIIIIALYPAILRPLPRVPECIIKAKGVSSEHPGGRRGGIAVTTSYPAGTANKVRAGIQSVCMMTLIRFTISPVSRCARSPARRILPFGFAQQPVGLARLQR